ncbi:MAG TPA: hypothetical protein P5556_08685 [Candidatus Gastranaerophilales bacterium]|nr:hypothetical protein [Candidatus Gastranaerophilales bacterium]
MKNIGGSNWSREFNIDELESVNQKKNSENLLDDAYDALNKFYQKETKKSKLTAKRRKQAWQ